MAGSLRRRKAKNFVASLRFAFREPRTSVAACSRRMHVNRYDEYDNEVAGILSVAPSLFEGVGLRPPSLPIDDPDVVERCRS